jgi:hypothetical protein
MPKTWPLKTTNSVSDPLQGEHFDQESLPTRQKKLKDNVQTMRCELGDARGPVRVAPQRISLYSSAGSSGGETSIPVNTSKRKHILLLEKIIWPKEAPLKANLCKALGGRLFP